MWVIIPQTKWHFVKVLILALSIFPTFFTFMHLWFTRGDLDGLNDCARLGGIANCTRLHGTYDEIVADCVAWPPVFAERLSEYTERLCDMVLSDEGTDSPHATENVVREPNNQRRPRDEADDGSTNDGNAVDEAVVPTAERATIDEAIAPTAEPAAPEVAIPPTAEPAAKAPDLAISAIVVLPEQPVQASRTRTPSTVQMTARSTRATSQRRC